MNPLEGFEIHKPSSKDGGVVVVKGGGSSIAQWLHTILAPVPSCPRFDSQHSPKISEENNC